MFLGSFQQGRLHNPSAQSVPGQGHPHSKETQVQVELPVRQFLPIAGLVSKDQCKEDISNSASSASSVTREGREAENSEVVPLNMKE